MTDMILDADRDGQSSTHTPNFFYIGTSKAGSTWIYGLLARHPRVYMAPGKGLYFFDEHYDRGFEWHLSHFKAPDDKCVGEVAHGYRYSSLACQRIARFNRLDGLVVDRSRPCGGIETGTNPLRPRRGTPPAHSQGVPQMRSVPEARRSSRRGEGPKK